MMMARSRHRSTDNPPYDPTVERRPALWNSLDTTAQRLVAWGGALLIILSVCAWAADTIKLNTRVTALEAQTAEAKELARANLAVTCILARKVDPTVEPQECKGR